MKRFAWAALALLGCTLEPSDGELRVQHAMQSYLRDADKHIVRKRALIAADDALRQSYDRQTLTYARAEQNFQLAIADFRLALSTSEAAAATAERARVLWDFYQKLVVIAAMVDAYNIDTAVAHETVERFSLTCEHTSTRQFRGMKMSEGVSVDGMDVDHIIPRHWGGADHVLNYQLLPLSENRAFGAGGGLAKCMMVGPFRCALAVMVSIQCGSFQGF